jgi:hypothetical protein
MASSTIVTASAAQQRAEGEANILPLDRRTRCEVCRRLLCGDGDLPRHLPCAFGRGRDPVARADRTRASFLQQPLFRGPRIAAFAHSYASINTIIKTV